MTRTDPPILIAGAGVAGLAAALSLSAKGFKVHIVEKRAGLSEAGAGIQIGPNGVKALAALGVRAAVERVAFRPAGIGIHDGRSGAMLTRLPLGPAIEARCSAPYLTLLRAELQAALLAAVRARPGVTLETGFDLAEIDQQADGVTGRCVDGRPRAGAALIAADGLWSRVRALQGAPAPVPSGYAAFRALIPRTGENPLPAPCYSGDVCLWLGRSAHVVHYPVEGGAQLNVVVIVRAAPGPADWDQPGAIADLGPHLSGWAPQLVAALQHAPQWRRWSVFTSPPAGPWTTGRTLRIGDAAHPILPFLAQGAVMALEDAVALADFLAETPDDPANAFVRFETIRRSRVERVAAASKRNGAVYRLTGLPALARDAVLRWTPPSRLLGQYDWLYGYDVSGPA